ncbi:MAG: cytochrome C biogenesis protein, partial [Deltaproteobacteria bacterium]|nr:cytochrome C biogenesis protein [Deltaproteobacteria bacterium]
MMQNLLFWLNDAVSGAPLLALLAAFLWGLASVLLSPCHLGMIPLVVGFISADRGRSRAASGKGRGTLLAFSFAGGMLLAILGVGALVMALGHAVSGQLAFGNYLIAAIFLVAGLNLLGIVPLPDKGLTLGKRWGHGVVAAVAVGLVLGIGLSPCTFAFLAPVLGATAAATAHNPLFGMSLLLAFAVGHCGLVGVAGSS